MTNDTKYHQLSIYDFLESQEVAPSEMHPQVDEAQEVKHTLDITTCKVEYIAPSSDLDTCKDCLNAPMIDGECSNPFCKPTEETDEALFSVGDVLTVKRADDVYDVEVDNVEDYYALKEHQCKKVTVESITDGYHIVASGINFYASELQK